MAGSRPPERPLRVAIDARRPAEGLAGGVEQVVIGLAHGLSSLTDSPDEYLFLTAPPDDRWIAPYLSGGCRVLPSATSSARATWRGRLKAIPGLRATWDRVSPVLGRRTVRVPRSDGTIEQAGAEVVHFPLQSAFLTGVPSVYQPHDLQHLHLPQYFTARARLGREVRYRAFCAQAHTVVMMTRWGKEDLTRRYELPRAKVCVVPGASVLDAYAEPTPTDIDAARARLELPDQFAFFPAQTFPHKNHLMLLEALAIARDRMGVTIPLVASGYQNEFFPRIARRMSDLRLEPQVRFVGFVSPVELRALYRLARCMVFPSAFEGWGLPVVEAFHEATPVACADATSLPEVAGDAALLFPVDSPAGMAEQLVRLWRDEKLRADLIARGRSRATALSWTRTARIFRAHYRRIAGRQLDETDSALIAESCGCANGINPGALP
ncbi:MAG TPA: glycosyltransferase family 1 protein [Gemmatimonadaceae bacterium]|nr:glycosyltransferase family 1 protein [Gemmatimonadaceae bacterium]